MTDKWTSFLYFAPLLLILAFIFRERKRNRIERSFLSAIIKHIAFSKNIDSADSSSQRYWQIIYSIKEEIGKDFWANPYYKIARKGHFLFWEDEDVNGEFNGIYKDVNCLMFKEWYAMKYSSNEDEIFDEEEGEKLIYRDIMQNKLKNFKYYFRKDRYCFLNGFYFKYLSDSQINEINDKLKKYNVVVSSRA